MHKEKKELNAWKYFFYFYFTFSWALTNICLEFTYTNLFIYVLTEMSISFKYCIFYYVSLLQNLFRQTFFSLVSMHFMKIMY